MAPDSRMSYHFRENIYYYSEKLKIKQNLTFFCSISYSPVNQSNGRGQAQKYAYAVQSMFQTIVKCTTSCVQQGRLIRCSDDGTEPCHRSKTSPIISAHNCFNRSSTTLLSCSYSSLSTQEIFDRRRKKNQQTNKKPKKEEKNLSWNTFSCTTMP